MDVQKELDRVLHWIAALLMLLLQWLYPRVPRSHVLSRMFYDHLTLSHDLTYWIPTLFISLLHCILWGFGLSVQMHGKPFPVWGSHNTMQMDATILTSLTPAYIASFQCQICLGYSQYFGVFVSLPPIAPMPNIEQETSVLSHINQNNVLPEIQATDHTSKCV